MAEKEKVYREHIVSDQGNGVAVCSKCGADLSPTGPLGRGPAPYPCPGCGAEYEEGGMWVQGGGSDF
jgi:rubrerythrin